MGARSEEGDHKPSLLGPVALYACYPALITSNSPVLDFLLFPYKLLVFRNYYKGHKTKGKDGVEGWGENADNCN